MNSARVLEICVAAQPVGWMVNERWNDLAQMPAGPKRKLSAAMLKFTLARPKIAQQTLNQLVGLRGLRYLGAGIEFSTYQEKYSDQAIKVHRRSAGMNHQEKCQLADEKRTLFKEMLPYLAAFTIEQTVSVQQHILGGPYEALQIRQPYIQFNKEDTPFISNQPTVDVQAVADLTKRIPGIDDAYKELITQSRSMLRDKQLLPDTNGQYNIVAQPDGNLALLDSTPIVAANTWGQEIIQHQLNSLERALHEVA